MKWKLRFEARAEKEFFKLDKQTQKRIEKAIDEKLLLNPDIHLIPLTADLQGLYKFRVGDYRLICKKEEEVFIVVVLKVKHRREVYD
jgi:mRNA interferase RelE/StbE